MVLCVTGYLLHRVQVGIHMLLHDLLIIAFRDLPRIFKPLRLADRPRQPKVPSRDPPQNSSSASLHIRDQCVRRAPLIPCVSSLHKSQQWPSRQPLPPGRASFSSESRTGIFLTVYNCITGLLHSASPFIFAAVVPAPPAHLPNLLRQLLLNA